LEIGDTAGLETCATPFGFYGRANQILALLAPPDEGEGDDFVAEIARVGFAGCNECVVSLFSDSKSALLLANLILSDVRGRDFVQRKTGY
jgi:hypothetical protein